MAQYETGYVTTTNDVTINYPSAKAVRPQPSSPGILSRLADAAHLYAKTSEAYIHARDDLSDARIAYNELRDEFAKAAEQEGV